MSNLSDDEGLFDDIYGEDEVEQKQELTPQETTTATSAEPSDLQQLSETLADSLLPPPPPPPPLDGSGVQPPQPPQDNSLDPTLLQRLQEQLQEQVMQQVQRQKASLESDASKMFIGGLHWDTNEDSLRDHFSKYGHVVEVTIMRDPATSKSRGFGFLTFAEARSVDELLKESHELDGKLIDPKRAIPREEQDKTGKIFVGGISPDVTEQEFYNYFQQYGDIIDAQLMINKDTGKSRGFGFVTYDSPDLVDRVTENTFVMFKGRKMEIKRANPRGHQNSGSNSKFYQQQQYQSGQPGMGNAEAIQSQFGLNPEMAQQYWQQMQQYFMQQMQQQYAANGMAMDPAMLQQFQYMQQQMQQGQYPDQEQQQYGENQQVPNIQADDSQDQDQDQVVNIQQQQQFDNLPREPRRIQQMKDIPKAPRGPRGDSFGGRDYNGGRGDYNGGRGDYNGGRREYSGGRNDYNGGRSDYNGGRGGRGGRGRGRGGRGRGDSGFHPYSRRK